MTEPTGARVGVLIVTHGEAGAAMLSAVRALVGAAEGFEAISVSRDQGRESVASAVGGAIHRLDAGAGVLVLCDLFGSTPVNCAVELQRRGARVVVMTGVNLPMLVKLASIERRGTTPAALAHAAAETALRSIKLGDGGTP